MDELTVAQKAEKAYRKVLGYEDDSTIEQCISDLLTDLRHLCDETGYRFDHLNERAERNYLAETEETY